MSKKASGSSVDTVIKLTLVFFISLFSFSVGTFVGKQVSDADYRRAAIEGDYDHFQAEAKSEHGNDDNALSDDDIASLTEEFVNTEKRNIASTGHAKEEHADGHGKKDPHAKKEEHSDKPTHAEDHHPTPSTDKHKPNTHDEHAKTPAHEDSHKKGYKKFSKAEPSEQLKEKAVAQKELMTSQHGTHSVAKAAARVAEGKAPAEDAHNKESRKPTSVLPGVASSAIGKFTVQVASYADEAEAKAHSAKLKGKGWNAFYIPADVKGHTWYRVSVGLFSTTASAEKFKAELMKEANISSALVQKIIQ
ncbi:MAG: SPOR domain-containing protein [Bdellovibrionales bacterium]|nr:SPOR domain-containing protein [Bdellovibrionales bacterium]